MGAPRQFIAITVLVWMVQSATGRGLVAGQQPAATSPKGVDQKFARLFPEGDGKEIVMAACVQCHGLGEIVSHRMDTKGWQKSILDMVARGTQLLPGESETLVPYLAASFGPLLNINTATATELANLPSVDRILAEAIVGYREKNGPFKEIHDISKVEGVNAQILDKIKDRIATSPANDAAKKK